MRKEEFYKLIATQLPTLLLQAHTLMHNDCDAEDLLQDTLLLILEKRSTYVNNNFGAWAYALLYNLWRNITRHRNDVVYSDNLSEYERCYHNNIEKEYDIRHSLATVSHKHRSTIELYLQGYQYDEIAQQQELEMGTVKSRISRARKHLQSLLQEYR